MLLQHLKDTDLESNERMQVTPHCCKCNKALPSEEKTGEDEKPMPSYLTSDVLHTTTDSEEATETVCPETTATYQQEGTTTTDQVYSIPDTTTTLSAAPDVTPVSTFCSSDPSVAEHAKKVHETRQVDLDELVKMNQAYAENTNVDLDYVLICLTSHH